MDISNARTRLRRTFHYPTDESSNGSTPEVLDEEGMLPGHHSYNTTIRYDVPMCTDG